MEITISKFTLKSPQSHLLISLEHAYTLVKCLSFISTKIIENRIAEQSTIKLNRKWLSVKQITKPGKKQKKLKKKQHTKSYYIHVIKQKIAHFHQI